MPIALGTALGAYSHLVFDGLMHADMTPFAPFTDANPPLDAIPVGALHWACIAATIAGLVLIAVRRARNPAHR